MVVRWNKKKKKIGLETIGMEKAKQISMDGEKWRNVVATMDHNGFI